jgi:dipeptidyl aminopeptidase/acylaminoacyl peptidase
MRLRSLITALFASTLLAGPTLAVDYPKGPLVDPAAGAPRKGGTVAPDVELFFKNPRFGGVTLSPDGKYAAALVGAKDTGRRNLMLVDLADPRKSRFLTNLKETDIQDFFWKGNDRLVFSLDSDGNESRGLYSVDTGEKPLIRVLIDAKKLETGRSADTIDELEDSPDEILVQYNQRDVRYPDVYRLNVINSKLTMAARNEGDVIGWFPDRQGVIRGAYKVKGRDQEVLYRSSADAPWQTLSKTTFPEAGWQPRAMDFDGRTMYISTNVGHDKAAIYKYDPETKTQGELVYKNDKVDAGGLIFSDKEKKLIGVTYNDDKVHRVYTDAAWAALMKGLEDQFPGQEVGISSMTKDEMLMTIAVFSDTDPGSVYLFDRAKNSLKFLVRGRPDIDPKKMSPMKPFEFTTRDGLTVHGYITIPKDAKGPVPLIVNPHGGPFGVRDNWGFNPEHQFFAQRGYASMQVNYRGSGGYGKTFHDAGFKKWGREMQNDLTDAVKWAIAQGHADASKVCIYGGSYGGYATMAGLTFTPELYKCGVNYVGVVDIPLLFTTMPKYWEPQKDVMKFQIGDPETEKQLLHDASPLNFVQKIQAPIFIVQGGKDPRVVRKHAEYLRSAMDKHDKPYEWLMRENEGHGFRKEENRLELYTRMGDFFAKHLAPPAGSNPAP